MAKVEHLTVETFKEKIFDFETKKEWNYEGERPVLIDFYANWCNPCKMVAPILEELKDEYDGKIDIYKVDTEDQTQLSQIFKIQSIPSLLFIPLEGMPQMAKGALPKEGFVDLFKQIFNISDKE